MSNFLQASQLRNEARRLLRYRMPLMLAVLCNFLLLIRFPFAHSQTEAGPLPAPATVPRGSDASLPDTPTPDTPTPDTPTPNTPTLNGPTPNGPTDHPAHPTRHIDAPDTANATGRTTGATQRDLVRTGASRWVQTLRTSFARWRDGLEPKPASAPARPAHSELTLRNPRGNDGPVSLLVNSRLCTLGPGEAHAFTDGSAWVVQFHRGGTFGNAELTLTSGRYDFVVTDHGWTLAARP